MTEYLSDVEADIIARYPWAMTRYGSIRQIPSALFLKLAYTLPRLEGTWMHALALAEQQEREERKKKGLPESRPDLIDEETAKLKSPRAEMLAARAKKKQEQGDGGSVA